MSLVLVSSTRFVDHVTPVGHPERPERAGVLTAVAESFAAQGGRVLAPRLATDVDLERVHTREHIDAIVATRGRATMIDEDTYTSPESEEIARLAAGAVLAGVDHALDGPEKSRALVMVRPPGHHAEAASSWTLKSWDRTQIPKPFTTVAMAIGEPIYIPRDADDAALETWRQQLRQSLADCRKKCAELLWH